MGILKLLQIAFFFSAVEAATSNQKPFFRQTIGFDRAEKKLGIFCKRKRITQYVLELPTFGSNDRRQITHSLSRISSKICKNVPRAPYSKSILLLLSCAKNKNVHAFIQKSFFPFNLPIWMPLLKGRCFQREGESCRIL